MTRKFPLRISKLDKLLDGGVPTNSIILLEGRAGVGKSFFCYYTVNEVLKNHLKCVFVTTRMDPERLVQDMEDGGFDIRPDVKEGRIIFIDSYSPTKLGRYLHCELIQLNDLFTLVTRLLRRRDVFLFVFDSITDLFLRNKPSEALRFLRSLSPFMRRIGLSLLTLQHDVLHEKVVASIEYLCDGIFWLDVKRGRRVLHVKKMRGVTRVLPSLSIELKDGILVREFFKY